MPGFLFVANVDQPDGRLRHETYKESSKAAEPKLSHKNSSISPSAVQVLCVFNDDSSDEWSKVDGESTTASEESAQRQGYNL